MAPKKKKKAKKKTTARRATPRRKKAAKKKVAKKAPRRPAGQPRSAVRPVVPRAEPIPGRPVAPPVLPTPVAPPADPTPPAAAKGAGVTQAQLLERCKLRWDHLFSENPNRNLAKLVFSEITGEQVKAVHDGLMAHARMRRGL